MTDKKQGYQPEIGITTNPPNCSSGVQAPEKGRVLINIPKEGNYIEILGHRIDGFESFEAFLEHLKKYAELEETVKRQKAKIEKCADTLCKKEDMEQLISRERQQYYDELQAARAEIESLKEECFIKSQKRANIFEIVESFERGRIKGIKEFAEMIKIENRNELGYIVLEDEDVDDIVKEFIGDNNAER